MLGPINKHPRFEGILTVGERGQIVLPKALRSRSKIDAGDRLIAVCLGEGERSLVLLLKAENVSKMLKSAFGPILKEILE